MEGRVLPLARCGVPSGLVTAAVLALYPAPAGATDVARSNLSVTATVLPSCVVVSGRSIHISCTNGGRHTVISAGRRTFSAVEDDRGSPNKTSRTQGPDGQSDVRYTTISF